MDFYVAMQQIFCIIVLEIPKNLTLLWENIMITQQLQKLLQKYKQHRIAIRQDAELRRACELDPRLAQELSFIAGHNERYESRSKVIH